MCRWTVLQHCFVFSLYHFTYILRTGNLDLGINAVRGTIPTAVAGLPNLEQFRLRENRLTGTIPETLLDSGKLREFLKVFMIERTLVFRYSHHTLACSVCFDASSNAQMENYIPQGICIEGASDMAVACEDETAQACSCCVCWRTGSREYCKQLIYV